MCDTLTALSLTIPCVLDKPEVLAGVTEQEPKFPPWEFDTNIKVTPVTPMVFCLSRKLVSNNNSIAFCVYSLTLQNSQVLSSLS